MAKKFDKLQIYVMERKNDLQLRIFVNGQVFGKKVFVDPKALWESAVAPGEYYILTCGCGFPDCAYIEQSIIVRHEKGRVIWDCDDRYYPKVADKLDDDAPPKFFQHQFKYAAYVKTIDEAMKLLRSRARSIGWKRFWSHLRFLLTRNRKYRVESNRSYYNLPPKRDIRWKLPPRSFYPQIGIYCFDPGILDKPLRKIVGKSTA